MLLRRAAACLLALVALAVAGCGDTEQKNAYVDAVNRAQTTFATSVQRLRDDVTATSTPEQDRRTLGRFKAAVDDAVGQLRSIEPPDGLAGLHDKLIGEIGRYGSEIDKARSAIATADLQRVRRLQTELISQSAVISRAVQAVITDINAELRG